MPLSEAWLEFASTQARDDFKKMPTGLEELKKSLEKSSEIIGVIEAASDGLNARAKRSAFGQQLKEELLDKLFNSDLLAFGYRQTPSESRSPVQIGPIFFEYPVIDWEANSAEFNGKKYRAIGILNPVDLLENQKLKTGHPSSGPVINSAIHRLMKFNPEFCAQPRSIACEQIRQTIGKQSKPGNGLSDKNLEKYIIANCGRRQIPK